MFSKAPSRRSRLLHDWQLRTRRHSRRGSGIGGSARRHGSRRGSRRGSGVGNGDGRVYGVGVGSISGGDAAAEADAQEGDSSGNREREAEEVRWYEAVIGLELDEATLVVLGEILASERHHLRDLRGKWMSA